MTRREFAKNTALAFAGAAILPNAIGKVLVSSDLSVQDWATRMIYFVLTDRFCDGNAANNDLGFGEYNPNHTDYFQGGDLAGVRKRLPYIKSLGFDALWVTPPVRNTIADTEAGAKTYHGYAAYDFMEVDPHFGTLADYKALVQEAHALGIKVIQDIVVNHTGNFIGLTNLQGQTAPNDPVFRLNDPNNPEHRAAAIYNTNAPITDYSNREQTLTHSLSTLDDINLRTPAARRRMLEIYRYWIQECGVDAFRIDTVYYTEPEFYDYFMHNSDANDLGIRPFAAKLGKPDFLVFGETWKIDIKEYPLLEEYLVSPEGKPRIDSSIDFPLNMAFSKVFYEKTATRVLADCLAVKRTNAPLWVNFLDNHDVERVANRAPWEAIQQAMVCMFTLPGIPCVYYGTEHGFKVTRENMFAEKWYTNEAKEGKLLKQLTALRASIPAFALGKLEMVQAFGQNGVVAYRTTYGKEAFLTVFNTASQQKYLVLPEENEFEVIFSNVPDATTPWQGHSVADPGAFVVLKRKGAAGKAAVPALALPQPAQDAYPDNANFLLGFAIPPAFQKSAFSLLFNDNADGAQPFTYLEAAVPQADATGNDPCHIKVFATDLLPGENTLRLMADGAKGRFFSNSITIQITEHFDRIARIAIPEDQRKGVDDNLRQPTEPSYGAQLTMEAVTIWEGMRYLKVEMLMKGITDAWNPPNGFDHVYFHIMFDLSRTANAALTEHTSYLPRLNFVPNEFAFTLGYMASGWSMVAHTADGAKPDAFGARIPANVRSVVDKAKRTVTLLIPKSDLIASPGTSASPVAGSSLKGTKIFVATWDGYLDDLRGIKSTPEDWNFSVTDGSDPSKTPKVFSYGILEI